jgi:hypothetical protein
MGLVEVAVVIRFAFGAVDTAPDGRSKALLAASIGGHFGISPAKVM